MSISRRNLLVSLGAAGVAAGVAAVRHTASRIRSRPGVPLGSLDLGPTTTHHLEAADGAGLHVVEYGVRDAPPVVLLHGVVLQWWMWNAVGRLLARDHRVVAWDMRGHGRSTLGTGGMTLAAAAGDLRLLVDRLALEGAVAAGYSMGGMVLGRLLVDDPPLLERFSGLALLSTSASPAVVGRVDAGSFLRSRLFASAVGAVDRRSLLDLASRPTMLTEAAIGSIGLGSNPTAALVADVRSMTHDIAPGVTSAALRSMAEHDVRHLLPRITRPTVVMVGQRDLMAPPAHSRLLADRIPGAEMVVVPGAGHGLPMERPQPIARALRSLADVYQAG